MSKYSSDGWDDDDCRSPYMFETPSEYALAKMHRDEIEEANRAVEAAMAAFKMQTRWQTFVAKLRFYIYWASYKTRELLATYLVSLVCRLTNKDGRLVSQKLWRMFRI